MYLIEQYCQYSKDIILIPGHLAMLIHRLILHSHRLFCQLQSHKGLVSHSGAQERVCGLFSEPPRKTSFSDGGPILYFSYMDSAFLRNEKGSEKLMDKRHVSYSIFLFSNCSYDSLLQRKKKMRYYQGVSNIM